MEAMESLNYSYFDDMDYDNLSKFLEEMDYSEMLYIGERKVVPHWEAIIKITVYVVIIIAAIIGNVLIIVVVVKNKRMRTTTNFFIVNLAVADLLVTAFCTWVHVVDNLTEGWVLGTFFCKMNSFTQGK